MNTSLAAQQTELLDALNLSTIDLIANYSYSTSENRHISFENPGAALRGLRAYRANAQAVCVSALQSCYPIMQQMIGEANFQHVAQDLWLAKPPQRGDLAQWGSALAAYLQQVPQLQDMLRQHAYLPDVARVEWALHTAASASDAVLDAASFELLTHCDPMQLALQLGPGSAMLRSAYPVVALVQLHDARGADSHPAARQAIASGEPQTALIWRYGLRPMLASAEAASAALIEATLQGESLAAALDAAFVQAPDFDFSAWLTEQVQAGLLLGAFRKA